MESGAITGEIVAAGAVVSRKGPQVLLIHRPTHRDWTFPKGKLDPGEHAVTAAVREVAEETGLDIRLGPPLADQTYEVGNGSRRPKRVHYWAGRLFAGDSGESVMSYRPNAEVDEVVWLDLDDARKRLTYPRDRLLLDEFAAVRKRSTPLLVVRHAKARSRKSWRGKDAERPLTRPGELQADQLVPILGAYGVRRVVSSSSRRCWTTLAPYADLSGADLTLNPALAEETASAEAVTDVVHELLGSKEPAALCTHRPVLPLVLDAVGAGRTNLDPGRMLVVHHRSGQVVAAETHGV